jgi:hypothetical protein
MQRAVRVGSPAIRPPQQFCSNRCVQNCQLETQRRISRLKAWTEFLSRKEQSIRSRLPLFGAWIRTLGRARHFTKSPHLKAAPMCEKCVAIDAKIGQYKELFADLDDQTARTLIDLVIADLEAEKEQLHAERK